MKVEEAIVYLLAGKNGGMTAEQLASAINERKLHVRKDGQPVSTKQIWWAGKLKKAIKTISKENVPLWR